MQSTQNIYLKTMYILETKYNNIRVTDIANTLGYTKSSVSKALKKLEQKKLIKYETYGDIILLPEAKSIVEKILIKEDLLELFFIGVLNIDEATAKKDINIISESFSDITQDKLKEYIKNTLKINCSKCSKQECITCETKKLKNRVSSNPKWIEVLKEEK